MKTVVPHNAPLNGEPMPISAPEQPSAPTNTVTPDVQNSRPVLDTPLEEQRPSAAVTTAAKAKATPTPQRKAKTTPAQAKREPEGTVAAKFMQRKLQEMTSFVSPPPQQQQQQQQGKETATAPTPPSAPPIMFSPVPQWKPVPAAERQPAGQPMASPLQMTGSSTKAPGSRQYQQAQYVRPTLPGVSRAPSSVLPKKNLPAVAPSFARFAFGTPAKPPNDLSNAVPLTGENKGPPPLASVGVQLNGSHVQAEAPLKCINNQQPLATVTKIAPLAGAQKGAVAKRPRVHGAGLSWLTAKYQADANNQTETGLVAPSNGEGGGGGTGKPEHTPPAADFDMSSALGFL